MSVRVSQFANMIKPWPKTLASLLCPECGDKLKEHGMNGCYHKGVGGFCECRKSAVWISRWKGKS